MAGLYQITNTINGHFYIGSTTNFRERQRRHWQFLTKGKHNSPYLQRAWNRYGAKAFKFQVLCILESSQLRSSEERLLQLVLGEGCYNVGRHARAPMLGRKHTAKVCAVMSKKAKVRWRRTPLALRPTTLGLKFSAETRALMSAKTKAYWALR
jgi:group I intron endonuclease